MDPKPCDCGLYNQTKTQAGKFEYLCGSEYELAGPDSCKEASVATTPLGNSAAGKRADFNFWFATLVFIFIAKGYFI